VYELVVEDRDADQVERADDEGDDLGEGSVRGEAAAGGVDRAVARVGGDRVAPQATVELAQPVASALELAQDDARNGHEGVGDEEEAHCKKKTGAKGREKQSRHESER
jgi:hypothetical protein